MTSSDNACDIVVIGGGVIGLMIAAETAAAGLCTILLEARGRTGEQTSTRNSGVMHAGLYYPAGWLRTRLCLEGRALWRELLPKWNVVHFYPGKFITASTAAEIPEIERLYRQGVDAGVEGLRLVDGDYVRSLEPWFRGVAAVDVPCTGVVDTGELLPAAAAHAERAGATIICRATVDRIRPSSSGFKVGTNERGKIAARLVVNAAGLVAHRVAALLGPRPKLQQYFCRGDYALVVGAGRNRFKKLVYPVPGNQGGTGVHITVTPGGEVWLGPSATWTERPDDWETKVPTVEWFASECALIGLDISSDELRRGHAGVRPKLSPPGAPAVDFHIAPDEEFPDFLNLIGMESPGLTAAPAIGRMVRLWAEERMG